MCLGELGPGLWNAWTYMAAFVLFMLLPDLGEALRNRPTSGLFPPFSGAERKHDMAWKVTFLIAMVFSFFQPLKCAGYWLILGAGVCLGGFALWLWAIVAIITSERCKPFATGPYAHSRHPMYIAHALVLLGISISTASVGFLTISLILISLSVLLALDEEASCLLHFGEEYERYMDATPRWLGT